MSEAYHLELALDEPSSSIECDVKVNASLSPLLQTRLYSDIPDKDHETPSELHRTVQHLKT